ncbi:MAG TPA: hypothetical protein VG757_09380 [Devosia sp.]|nr:hypothetical protein [Devosia sp.]
MAMIVYVFAALAMVIFVGWAVYVLPTPGPLGPMQLAIAMLPALTLLGTVLLGLAAL